MFGLLTKLRACTKGSPAVEFALLAPILVVVMTSLIDVSLMLADATALKKSVRAGAMAGARSPVDTSGGTPTITTATRNLINCIVRTGVPPTGGATCNSSRYILPGWADAGTSEVIVTPRYANVVVGGVTTRTVVIRVLAHVKFEFLVEGFLPHPTLEAFDEQNHISN